MTSGILTSPGIKAPGDYIEDVMISVKAKNPAEPEFHQAVPRGFRFSSVSSGEASGVSVRIAFSTGSSSRSAC